MSWTADELEEIPCDGCGGAATLEVVVRPDGMHVVECTRCGLAYLNPRPRAELVKRLYDLDYYRGGHAGTGYQCYAGQAHADTQAGHAEARLALVAPHLDVAGKRILEIGCATGEFCAAAAKRGATPTGIDLSAEAIEVARARYPRLDFRAAELDALPPEPRYDVIFGWEVVEHVLSPRTFVSSIARRLAPGGYLVLSTPNYACGKRVGPARWMGFLSSFEHLYFFDRASLQRLAEPAGLALVASHTGGGDGVASAEHPLRTMARRALERARLLELVRMLRRTAGRDPLGYSTASTADSPTGHNLVVVFRAGT